MTDTMGMEGTMTGDRLHTAKTGGALIKVSSWTIRSWWARGILPRHKVGKRLSRVWESELLKFVAEGGRPTAAQ
jgi:hypothetical protein